METIFKITATEFNIQLFKKIEDWVKNNKQSEIIISIKNESSSSSDNTFYFDSLKSSVEELSNGKSKIFSMEELEAYLTHNFS